MQEINITQASKHDSEAVTQLVEKLLIELEPSAKQAILASNSQEVTKDLLERDKIWVFIATSNSGCDAKNIGIITLHECASIYAGGVFGEISELYVEPEYRSVKVGEMLLTKASEFAKKRHWKRLEVGSPPANESPRTIKFYENQGFEQTGTRLRFLL